MARDTDGVASVVPFASHEPPGQGYPFRTAMHSISISNGPVHTGTQKKMRAGGFLGK